MKRFLAAATMVVSLAAKAEPLGELFWEPGMQPARFARAGTQLVFPGVPGNGHAGPRATRIALLSSGVAARHPQLAGYVVEAADFTGEGPEDAIGLGTALALVTLFGEGMRETDLAIVSAKVADRTGRVRERDVIEAIEWAAARGARVVHLGLGFRGTRSEHAELCDTIRRHWNVLFFASAGDFPRPTEIYPANCRVPNLHPTWANPAARPLVELAPDEILGPGMARLVINMEK